MAKKQISNLHSDVEIITTPAVASKPAETILVSLGGYNHSGIKTEDGFNLTATGLPSDFSAESGSTGHLLGSIVRRFSVVNTSKAGDCLQVKISMEV